MRVWDFKLEARDIELTTASVAQTVDAPEATCVLYFLRSLLRVASSIFQALRSGMMAVFVWLFDEGNGACSELLFLVIPERSPLAAAKDNYGNIFPVGQGRTSGSARTLMPAGWGTRWNAKRSLKTRVDRSASHNCPLNGPDQPSLTFRLLKGIPGDSCSIDQCV